MNQHNEQGQQHGYWEEVIGALTYKGYYVNGLREGVWRIYHYYTVLTLECLVKMSYENGMFHGYFEHYRGEYNNGENPTAFGNYHLSNKIGFWQEYIQDVTTGQFKPRSGVYKEVNILNTLSPLGKVEVELVGKDGDACVIQLTDNETIYGEAKYNDDKQITHYTDFKGNWYDSEVHKHQCAYNIYDLYEIEYVFEPEDSEYCKQLFSMLPEYDKSV